MAGVYIHIPFCKQACNYCNFHFSTSLGQKDALVAALVKEIAGAEAGHISTIYFGGGTPSILTIADLQQLFTALKERFTIATDAEITLEANPDDITTAKLNGWLNLGINRLSVGIQSFVEEELKWMNRAHTAAESLRCIDNIKAAGFTNFSVDLIYGSPILNNADWKKNVDLVIEKGIPHISCYALTVEPKTALDKLIAKGKKEAVSNEKQAEQFVLLMDWLQASGYEHYEISNFAKPGLRSRHNSSYWSGEKYYGFGPSAHAFTGSTRKWNIANNSLYIQAIENGLPAFEEETLTLTQRANEYTMTALRTLEGLSLDHVTKTFGAEYSSRLLKAAEKYAATRKLQVLNNALVLTNDGKLFADGIAADLFL